MKSWWQHPDRQPILITGSIRSGTTFLGKVLAKAKGCAFINEPFNLHNNELYGLHWERQYQFIQKRQELSEQAWLELQAALRLFKNESSFISKWGDIGHLRNKAIMLRDRLKPIKRVIIKDPIALASSPFLAQEFDMQVLYCVRHPAGFVASMKKLGWYISPEYFLSQPGLMKAYLQEYEAALNQFRTAETYSLELSVLMWKVANTIVHKQMQANRQAILIRHEDYSLAPETYFKQLFKSLDLEYNAEIEQFIAQTTHSKNLSATTVSHPHNIHINSKEVVHKWKTKLNAEEIAYIQENTKNIYPLFYSDIPW